MLEQEVLLLAISLMKFSNSHTPSKTSLAQICTPLMFDSSNVSFLLSIICVSICLYHNAEFSFIPIPATKLATLLI